MSQLRSLLLALFVALVVLVVYAVGKYYFFGWANFDKLTGDTVSWTAPRASDLRFRRASFTITMPDGKIYSKNVTPVLNGMAVANDTPQGSRVLALDRPLNPFSFQISGVNDPTSAPDPTAKKWKDAKVELKGQWRVI